MRSTNVSSGEVREQRRPTHSASSASAEANSAPKTSSPRNDQTSVRSRAAPWPRPVSTARVRPSHGHAAQTRRAARTSPDSTNPGSVRPRVTPHTHSAAPASRQSTTIQSASRTTVVAGQQHAQRRAGERERVAAVPAGGRARPRRRRAAPGRCRARGRGTAARARRARRRPPRRAGRPSRAGHARGRARSRRRGRRAAIGRTARRCGAGRPAGRAGRRRRWARRLLRVGGAGRSGGSQGEVDAHPGRRRRRAPGRRSGCVPPCRSVTHRAIASPRPVPPPPSVALRVPNGSKTRSRSAAATPGPCVVHLEPEPVARPPARSPARCRRAGLCRDGVVEQVGHQLPQPGGVGAHHEVGGVDADVVLHGAARAPAPRRPRRRAAARPATGSGVQRRLAGVDPGEVEQVLDEAGSSAPPGRGRPRASRGRGCRRRRRGSRARRRAPASGVRSSWLTLATSSRRCRSTAARSRAIVLNARASSPTSSLGGLGDADGVVAGRHPACRLGHLPQRGGHADGEQLGDRQGEQDRHRDAQPDRDAAGVGRAVATTAATVTLAATSRPSLTLSEVTRASGWRGHVRGLRPRARSRRRARSGSGRRPPWRAGPSRGCRRVRVPDAPGQPQTSAISRSRVTTAPGDAARQTQQVELGRRQPHLLVRHATPDGPRRRRAGRRARAAARPTSSAARSTRRSSAPTRATSSRIRNGLVR